MSPDDLEKFRSIVENVIKAESPDPILAYVIVAIIAAAAAGLAAYLGSYLQTAGQQRAIQENFEKILEQTKSIETLKTDIAAAGALSIEIRQGQFEAAKQLFEKLGQIHTNWNRYRQGQDVPEGFINKSDLVPLTEVYDELGSKNYLLGDELYTNLKSQADKMLEIAMTGGADKEVYQTLSKEFEDIRTTFNTLMAETFDI